MVTGIFGGKRRFTKTLLPLLGVMSMIILHCSDQEHSVASNSRTSGCDGFQSLSKMKAKFYKKDSADYCSAEKIRWSYDLSDKKLSLLHTRKLWNCAAEVKVDVRREGEAYILIETDERDKRISANCMCYFDTFCDVEGLDQNTISLRYAQQDYLIDPLQGEGVFVLDTASYWPCE